MYLPTALLRLDVACARRPGIMSESLRCMLCSIMIALQVSKVDPGTPQEDAKKALIEKIDTYIQVWWMSCFGGNCVHSSLTQPCWKSGAYCILVHSIWELICCLFSLTVSTNARVLRSKGGL